MDHKFYTFKRLEINDGEFEGVLETECRDRWEFVCVLETKTEPPRRGFPEGRKVLISLFRQEILSAFR